MLGARATRSCAAGTRVSLSARRHERLHGRVREQSGISIERRATDNGNLGSLPVMLSSSDIGPPSINLTRSYRWPCRVRVRAFTSSTRIQDGPAPSLQLHLAAPVGQQSDGGGAIHSHHSFNYLDCGRPAPVSGHNESTSSRWVWPRVQAGAGHLQAKHRGRQGQHVRLYRNSRHLAPAIFLAYLNGSKLATDATKYTGTAGPTPAGTVNVPLNPTRTRGQQYLVKLSLPHHASPPVTRRTSGWPTDINHGYVVTKWTEDQLQRCAGIVEPPLLAGLLFE